MRSRTLFRIAIGCVIVVVLGAIVIIPASRKIPSTLGAGGGEESAEIRLTGVVRDFRADHADFDVTSPEGLGHVAGNVNLWLSGESRPVFVGNGYKVDTPWMDQTGRPIAPHRYNALGLESEARTLGIRANGHVKLEGDCEVDAYDSTRGAYNQDGNYGAGAFVSTNAVEADSIEIGNGSVIWGTVQAGPGGAPGQVIDSQGLITGGTGTLAEPHPMPDVEVPADQGGNQGSVEIVGAQALTGDMNPSDGVDAPALRYDALTLKENSVVTVQGDLRIVTGDFVMEPGAEIRLVGSANLTLYVTNSGHLAANSQINPDGDTSAATVNYLGIGQVRVVRGSVFATMVAPKGKVVIENGHLYGAFVGESFKIKNGAVHIDTANAEMGSWNPAVTVMDRIKADDDSEFDSFDSNAGPYGGANVAAEAILRTNATAGGRVVLTKASKVGGAVLVGAGADPGSVIEVASGSEITGTTGALAVPLPIPVITPPPLGPSLGDVKHDGGVHVLDADLHCNTLKLENQAKVQVIGDVTVRVDDLMLMTERAEIEMMPGARLTLYVNDLIVEKHSKINRNTADPQRVMIRRMSLGETGAMYIYRKAAVYAWIQGPKSELTLEDHAEFFGSFIGDRVTLLQGSKFHVDMAYLRSCGTTNDHEGVEGVPSQGGITSASTFTEWFRDVVAVNQSTAHTIRLVRGADEVYEYLDDAFHPIDDELLGNEGQTHNHHLTYAIGAEFEYEECAGQFLELEGGDGAWVFVDGQLVLDLGGVMSGTPQYMDVDRLALVGGETYTLHLFYAQRNESSTIFRLRTNIPLSTEGMVPDITSQYD